MVDRAEKDIIKSATGRRIAPGKLEAIYSDSKFVEQIVVVGDNRKYLAALVVPNRSAIEAYFANWERTPPLISPMRLRQ